MTAANTKIVEAGHSGAPKHGLSPGTLMRLMVAGIGIAHGDDYVIIWAREQPGLYPTMAQTKSNPLSNLNGGVAADPDTVVATYGVYSRRKNGSFMLDFWADFDHWPLVADAALPTLMPGLADGHHHPGGNTGSQLPLLQGHRDLLLRIVAYIRFGQF